jgi:hypothetical protein
LCLSWLQRLLRRKMCDATEMRAGILIIGSLFWDASRQAWREERLHMAASEDVMAPIRYGRRSENRGNTYTMVFSCSALPGQAKVVPCSRTVGSARDLIAEAEHLWAAERNAQVERCISAGWGCVALLCNPDRNIPRPILTDWATRVSEEPSYGRVPHPAGEDCVLSAQGLLQIPWPHRVSDKVPVELDLLLATATRATLRGTPPSYPTTDAVASAWRNDPNNRVEYFLENQRCGIRTFQDAEIRERLENRAQSRC